MSAVDEIKEAIRKLSLEERAQIAAELCSWEDDDWDRQMKAEASTGKFDQLNQETEATDQAGESRSLRDMLGP